MPELFSISQLLEATGGGAKNIVTNSISSISIDSRSLERGALFVAIRGENFDGHDFVAKAIENGASAALISASREQELDGLPLIVVPDALAGLGDIARAARARSSAKIVAITGSAGKTTTKEALAAILGAEGKTHASIKSFNNHWGVPLMLAGLPLDARFGVFEMGMNHGGEISPLSEMVAPHVALVTSIGQAHLANFSSVAQIARAKGEIFGGLVPGGAAIINADHEHVELLKQLARDAGAGDILTYGFSQKADVVIHNPAFGSAGAGARIDFLGEDIDLEIGAFGAHMLANATGALCVARHLGVSIADALTVLKEFEAPGGRGAVLRLGPVERPLVLIDESYNANPASIAAALAVFGAREQPGGKKVLVLGDMYELGDMAPELHRGLAEDIVAARPDILFLIGEYMGELGEVLGGRVAIGGAAPELNNIKETILNGLDYGDLIMVKGSNGVGLGGLVVAIRNRFVGARIG